MISKMEKPFGESINEILLAHKAELVRLLNEGVEAGYIKKGWTMEGEGDEFVVKYEVFASFPAVDVTIKWPLEGTTVDDGFEFEYDKEMK